MAFQIEENIDLKPYNTFHVPARARYFVRIPSMSDLKLLFNEPIFRNNQRLILGGGSNCVFVNDFDGLVIKVEMRGIEVVSESASEILVKVASGEVWHDLVMYCLSKNWGGVENLSLIPGTVGAAPIQNIGAYGVEVKELVECVDGISLEDGVARSFTNEECKFSYRESIFKHAWSKIFFISSITLRLTTKNHMVD
jgi:UDP-N-acetylmuramate dehydrogenase